MSIGIVFAGAMLCAHAQWLKQAAEDFQRHQADLENAAGQDEAAVVRRAIQQTLTALQALGTRFQPRD